MNGTELRARIGELGIAPDELAIIVRRPLADVETWCKTAGAIGGEAEVLLRVLMEDHSARLAVERVRSRQTNDLRGEGAVHAGIDVPYGAGFAGTDGEGWS